MPMPYNRYTDYSVRYAMIAVVIICCLTLAGLRFIQSTVNDGLTRRELHNFEAEFSKIQHPTGTEQVSLRTVKGDFDASGQDCDFFLGEIRSCTGSEEAITTAYVGQMVEDCPVQVAFLTSGQIPEEAASTFPESLTDPAVWELPADAGEHALYMAYLAVLYFGNSNLRCK